MKKTLTILLSAVTVIALLLAYALPVSAAEAQFGPGNPYVQPTLNTNAASYYSQLINYYGFNVRGTCAYTAMSMLLTYYDAYYNDNIVPENMEMVGNSAAYGSPGTLFEVDLYDTYVVDQGHTYTEYIEEYSSSSLHLFLISLGEQKGFVRHINGDSIVQYGLYEDQIIDILYDYFLDYTGNPPVGFRVNFESIDDGYTQGQLVSRVTELVESGVPVMCLNYRFQAHMGNKLAFSGTEGHCLIAYDCINTDVISKDNIMVHKGHYSTETHISMQDSGFSHIYGIIWLDMSSTHVCSDNFYDGQCGCQHDVNVE